MLGASRARLEASLPDDAVVLDVGGWADPFARADWVIDIMPYHSRGLYERQGWIEPRADVPRFKPETWIERDVCDGEPLFFHGHFSVLLIDRCARLSATRYCDYVPRDLVNYVTLGTTKQGFRISGYTKTKRENGESQIC